MNLGACFIFAGLKVEKPDLAPKNSGEKCQLARSLLGPERLARLDSR